MGPGSHSLVDYGLGTGRLQHPPLRTSVHNYPIAVIHYIIATHPQYFLIVNDSHIAPDTGRWRGRSHRRAFGSASDSNGKVMDSDDIAVDGD